MPPTELSPAEHRDTGYGINGLSQEATLFALDRHTLGVSRCAEASPTAGTYTVLVADSLLEEGQDFYTKLASESGRGNPQNQSSRGKQP